MDDCLFCKISKKEVPAEIVFENDDLVIFPDINPKAPVHVIIIPRRHVAGVLDLNADDGAMIGHIFEIAARLWWADSFWTAAALLALGVFLSRAPATAAEAPRPRHGAKLVIVNDDGFSGFFSGDYKGADDLRRKVQSYADTQVAVLEWCITSGSRANFPSQTVELVGSDVTEFTASYFDGAEWLDRWIGRSRTGPGGQLPRAIHLVLVIGRQKPEQFETVIYVPTS